jgi:rare lipoprotein A
MMRPWPLLLLLIALCLVPACASTRPVRPQAVLPDGFIQEGIASYYGSDHHGRRTASGTVFNEHQLTAAHRTLPFGTQVRVTNLDNGRHIVLVVTDRGPFRKGRVIDVTSRAARDLGFLRAGVARVRVEAIRG